MEMSLCWRIILLLSQIQSILCKNYSKYDYFVIEQRHSTPKSLLQYNLFFDRKMSTLQNEFVYRIPKDMKIDIAELQRQLKSEGDTISVAHQKPKRRHRRDGSALKFFDENGRIRFDDPLFPKQWHLDNHIVPGSDVNVTGVWKQGIIGNNVTVCIVDDGVDYNHPDLREAYVN